MELTEAQTDQQDFVDNAIHHLLCQLSGKSDLDWDIANISEVREAVQGVLCDKLSITTEMEFYPYIELDLHPDGMQFDSHEEKMIEQYRVSEEYAGTREVIVDAPNTEEAINIVRVGGGTEVHRYEEPIAEYEAEREDGSY